MKSDQKMNTGMKIASAVLFVAVVTAAGVGLLVQHRKLREQRQTREHLERTNQQLVASRDEQVSANKELAGELYKLRDAERMRVANAKKAREALEGRAAAWTKERAAFSNRVATASADVKRARDAQSQAEKAVAELKSQVKDLLDANKKLRAEREEFRARCNSLERTSGKKPPAPPPAEKKPPAPQPEEKKPSEPPPASPTVTPPPVMPPSGPLPEKRTPEEQQKELDDLLNI